MLRLVVRRAGAVHQDIGAAANGLRTRGGQSGASVSNTEHAEKRENQMIVDIEAVVCELFIILCPSRYPNQSP